MREWLLLVLVIASVPFVLKRPFWGMLIYLGANIVRPEMLFWGGRGGSYVFMVYYVLILVGMFLQHDFKRIGLVMQREFLLMMWLAGAILLSIMLAQYPVFRGYYYVYELLKGFGICALLYLLVTNFKDISTLQNAMLGCFAFMAVWGIDQHLRGNDRLEGLGGSAWGDSNGVAAMFILILPVALAKMYTSENRKQFWVSLGITALIVALIVCTKSRAGFIGLFVSLAAFGFYARKTFRVAQIAIVLILVALPFATQEYIDRMKTMEGSEGLKQSSLDRVTMWKAGLMVFADNPLVGTGFLTFPEAKMKYEDRFLYLDDVFRSEVFRTQNKKVTHNTYIQILSDCGLLGIVPFLLLIFSVIRKGVHARKKLDAGNHQTYVELVTLSGICAGITGFAVCIFSMDSVLAILFYVQLVLAGILFNIIETNTNNSVALEHTLG